MCIRVSPDTSQERNCKLKAGCFFKNILAVGKLTEILFQIAEYFNAHRPIAMSSLVISSCFFDFCANLFGFELF
jgi:hypothetical protein